MYVAVGEPSLVVQAVVCADASRAEKANRIQKSVYFSEKQLFPLPLGKKLSYNQPATRRLTRWWLSGKELNGMMLETQVRSLSLGRFPLEEEVPTHSSILA